MHPRRTLPALLLVVALVAGCSGSSGSDASAEGPASSEADGAAATTTTTEPTVEVEVYEGDDDGFYAVPDPLPDAPHGTLIRSQRVPEADPEGAEAYRIMYLSESVLDEPIAVTGLATVPIADAPEGGRPMMTTAHGTTGIADECAPSKELAPNEGTLVRAAFADEAIVASTDYEGLGTPGRHPYLVGESEGRSVIDALLAARQLPDAEAGDRFGIAGYSQGGHGALWAAEVSAEWAPDLELVGTFSGAPASEVGILLAAAYRLPQAGFAYMVIAGIAEAYDADPGIVLTDRGVGLLDAVDEGCARDTFAAVSGIPVEELVRPGGSGEEPWATLGPAQDAGTRKTNDAPVLIIHSRQDETVPLFFSEAVTERMCAEGITVERRLLDEGSHGGAAPEAYRQAMDWMHDRFAGEGEPASTCP